LGEGGAGRRCTATRVSGLAGCARASQPALHALAYPPVCALSAAPSKPRPVPAPSRPLPYLNPRTRPTHQTLVAFIAFRKQTTRKRAADELAKALARQHIATGLRLALTHIDAIVKALRNARSLGEAQAALTAGGPVSAEAPVGDGRGDSGAEAGGGVVAGADADGSSGAALPPIVPGGLSSEQADAILAMPLRRLTTLETGRLDKELADLGAQIGELQTLMADDTVLTDTLLAETAAMRAQFGSERRTRISDEALELSEAGAAHARRAKCACAHLPRTASRPVCPHVCTHPHAL